jgi:hypothetical protein
MLQNDSNTILFKIYEKIQRNEENFWLNGRNTSNVHTCVAKMVNFWGWDFPFGGKSQNSGQAKYRLGTKCSDRLARRAGPAGPALGLTQRIFFSGTSHTYPLLDEVHDGEQLYSIMMLIHFKLAE